LGRHSSSSASRLGDPPGSSGSPARTRGKRAVRVVGGADRPGPVAPGARRPHRPFEAVGGRRAGEALAIDSMPLVSRASGPRNGGARRVRFPGIMPAPRDRPGFAASCSALRTIRSSCADVKGGVTGTSPFRSRRFRDRKCGSDRPRKARFRAEHGRRPRQRDARAGRARFSRGHLRPDGPPRATALRLSENLTSGDLHRPFVGDGPRSGSPADTPQSGDAMLL